MKKILFYIVWGLCGPFVFCRYLFSDVVNFRFGNKSTTMLKLGMVKDDVQKKAFPETYNYQDDKNKSLIVAQMNKMIKTQARKELYKQKK